MKKLFVIVSCIFSMVLVGCVSNKETTIKRVKEEELIKYDVHETEANKSYIYNISDRDVSYIVFRNMGIEPDQVTLRKEGSKYIVDIGSVSEDAKEGLYVFKLIKGEDMLNDEKENKASLVVTDGNTEYPFEFVAGY